MARRTVRVEVPIKKPDDFSKLCKDILDQNQTLGNNSPLKNYPQFSAVVMGTSLTEANGNRSQAEKLHEQAEGRMELARNVYGTAAGQSVDTPGTLYNQVDGIKDFLLYFYKGKEEQLSQFGFKVVVGEAKSPTKKEKK